jgi:hypothetical protein
MLLLASGAGWLVLAAGAWAVAPRRCPKCGRRALIHAQSGWGGGIRRLRPGEVPRPYRPGPYLHFWCVSCGTRQKRLRLGAVPWEDASGAAEDRYYDQGVRRNRANRADPPEDGPGQ